MISYVVYCESLEDGFRECESLNAAVELAKGMFYSGSIWRLVDGNRDDEPTAEFEGVMSAINGGRGKHQEFEFRV